MKIPALVLALGGIVGVATIAQAQTAAAPADSLTNLQNDFGAIVGEAFHRPDPLVKAVSTPGSPAVAAGVALRTSMEVPGAVFAGALKPFADADASAAPAAAPVAAAAPAPRRHRHVRVRHHRASGQG